MNQTASVINKINKKSWYFQGAAVVALTGSYPMGACLNLSILGKKIPVGFHIIGYMTKNYVKWWFPKDDMVSVANYYINKEVKNSGWINRLFNNWTKKVANLISFHDEINKIDLSILTNKELLTLLTKFDKVYSSFWNESIFLDAFDSEGDRILKQSIESHSGGIGDKELHILTLPNIISSLQQQRFDLLAIGRQVLSSQSASRMVRTAKLKQWSEQFSAQYKLLLKLQKKYFWICGDYETAPYLDINFFFKQLRELIVDKDHFKKESAEQNKMAALADEQKRLVKKLKLSNQAVVVLNFLRTLVTWRDLRKKYNIISNYFLLTKLLPELSRRSSWQKELIQQAYHTEFDLILRKDRQFKKRLVNRFGGRFTEFILGYKYNEYFGQVGKRIIKRLEMVFSRSYKELAGLSAYPGLVRGRVKIVLSTRDFYKMKKGDILVAPNTRPEYVPIMKLAAAMISDEGGITSHTAIVSREYHIPCVVGCQVATTILKDGDRVEVDAVKGLVKKL